MLSEELRNLAGRFDPSRHGGLVMESEQVELLVAKFRAMADDARELERMKVPEAARLAPADLSDGTVVRLSDHRIEQAKFGVHPGGGDAA